MTPAVNTTRHAALIACLLGAAASPARAQSPTLRQATPMPGEQEDMLTDQMPFCEHLAREVARLRRQIAGPHPEADRLATDGVRMCALGLVVPGIRRLRYAIVELKGATLDH